VGPGLRWNVHIEGGRGHLSPRLNVLENGVIVGRIFSLDAVRPQGRPWMRASGRIGDIKRAAFGYEQTREASIWLHDRHARRPRREHLH
jgi:hypothetical protein